MSSIFEQAEKTLMIGSWSLAGVGCRTAIDRAVQKLGETKGTLFQRIDRLKDDQKITPDLAAWAHHVRLGGNDGTHDLEDLTDKQAKELRDFAKLFLEMVFTMPKRIADAQTKRAADKLT